MYFAVPEGNTCYCGKKVKIALLVDRKNSERYWEDSGSSYRCSSDVLRWFSAIWFSKFNVWLFKNYFEKLRCRGLSEESSCWRNDFLSGINTWATTGFHMMGCSGSWGWIIAMDVLLIITDPFLKWNIEVFSMKPYLKLTFKYVKNSSSIAVSCDSC